MHLVVAEHAAPYRVVAKRHEARYEADEWEMPIFDFLINKQRVTLLEITQHLKVTTDKLGRAALRIAAALERRGWERGPRVKSARYWIPKDTWEIHNQT